MHCDTRQRNGAAENFLIITNQPAVFAGEKAGKKTRRTREPDMVGAHARALSRPTCANPASAGQRPVKSLELRQPAPAD